MILKTQEYTHNQSSLLWYVVILESYVKEVSPTFGTIDSGLPAGLFAAGLVSGIVVTLSVVGIILIACKLSQPQNK